MVRKSRTFQSGPPLDHLLTPHTGINSAWIKELNVRLETIHLPEENVSSAISDVSPSRAVSDISPWAREVKEKISKQNCSKIF